ncbi:MAG TPA: restriction endonuclease [Gemmatimonadaceae bacterium]|nr:restriction endonuclease [Gemmatimonadaceae bacterium]
MGDPRSLLPHEVEIFVVRELRKAGLDPAGMKVRDRTRGSGGPGDYAVELLCSLRIAESDRRILIECRNEPAPIARALVEALHEKLADAKAQHAMMFSTSGFDADAARLARTLGVPLLAVADGKTAFARSPWGMAGDPPAWVPEYMAELVELDVMGQLRRTLLASGGSKRILDLLATSANPKTARD